MTRRAREALRDIDIFCFTVCFLVGVFFRCSAFFFFFFLRKRREQGDRKDNNEVRQYQKQYE